MHDTAVIAGEESDPAGLLEQIRKNAAVQPDASAVYYDSPDGPVCYTYRELDARSSALAQLFRARGLVSGSIAALLLERSADLIVSLLGVLKAGGVYLIADPAYPDDRIKDIVSRSRAVLLITNSLLVSRSEPCGCSVVNISDTELFSGNGTDDTSPSDDAPAAVYYTSGTTGRPKGVLLSYGALSNLAASKQFYDPAVRPSPGKSAAVFFSPSFIAFAGYVWSNLYGGAAVYLLNEQQRSSFQLIDRFIREHSITGIGFTPGILNRYMQSYPLHLQDIVLGGERCLLTHPLTCPYVNIYGMTENCADIGYSLSGPYIDHAALNTRIYSINEDGSLCKKNETGELCVSGRQVFTGYLYEPELTAERLVSNPFYNSGTDRPYYARMIKTGDLGRFRDDGSIEITGRRDFQIKINGIRIEIEEVENRARSFADISDAAAAVQYGKDGSVKQFYLFYSSADSENPVKPQELRRRLLAVLPQYMVPALCICVPELPKNQNGKTDRKSLLALAGTEQDQTVQPLKTETEKKLAVLFGELLHLPSEKIGADSDFLKLGGDSLQAMMLMEKIRCAFQAELFPYMIFMHPVLSDLAGLIDARKVVSPDIFCYCKGRPGIIPLVFVHTANTGVESYRNIAGMLSADIPFYCIENHNLIYKDLPVSSIHNLAAYYIYHLKSMLPSGPYILGGWSFGGVVAFEMALQLVKSGEQVPRLYVLDSSIINGDARDAIERASVDPQLKKYFETEALFTQGNGNTSPEELYKNNMHVMRYMADYRPESAFTGDFVLFKATVIRQCDSIKKAVQSDALNGFSSFVTSPRCIEIETDHDALGIADGPVHRITGIINTDYRRSDNHDRM